MPETWTRAVNAYNYPVTLSDYGKASEFPNHFMRTIAGDRTSTIEFENYFRANYSDSVEPYLEVVFWKLYSQRKRFGFEKTDRIVDNVLQEGVTATELRGAIDLFVEKPTKANLSVLRARLGLKSPVLAVALTFPAFVDPFRFPMVDMQTARWITSNHPNHNQNRRSLLTPFKFGYPSLQDNDFPNYINWVAWCREIAHALTDATNIVWRARDVEMAVFTAARQSLPLNPLP
jgi:hypothetical protein